MEGSRACLEAGDYSREGGVRLVGLRAALKGAGVLRGVGGGVSGQRWVSCV